MPELALILRARSRVSIRHPATTQYNTRSDHPLDTHYRTSSKRRISSSTLPPTSLDALSTANCHPAHLQFSHLGYTTKDGSSRNCVFKHNFDPVFSTPSTLIVFDLIVLECLILPPAILLVRHAFRIAIPATRIMILRVRRISARRRERMLARGADVNETWTFGGFFFHFRA